MVFLVLGRGKTGQVVADVASQRGHSVRVIGEEENTNASALTAPMLAQGLKVDLPQAKSAQQFNPKEPIVVSVTAAGKVAAAVVAEKLVMVSDTHGIRRDINDPASRVSSLNEAQIKEMIDAGIITDAMFPKVEACMIALEAGVKKAHIIDGRIAHSLLLEIYTEQGIGTEIVRG